MSSFPRATFLLDMETSLNGIKAMVRLGPLCTDILSGIQKSNNRYANYCKWGFEFPLHPPHIRGLDISYRQTLMNLSHTLKAFDELTVYELYDLLRLRSEVFVVEQNCVFLDQDDKDQKCHHVLLYAGRQLAAYCRLVPAGLSYKEAAIGRVVSSPEFRGKGMGRKVMKLGIDYCQKLYGNCDIRLGAQTYALDFYKSLGFVPEGETYDEDGIEHIEMVKRV